MTWIGAVIHLWLRNYCFKHHIIRTYFPRGPRYGAVCKDCWIENHSFMQNLTKTEKAMKRLGWK